MQPGFENLRPLALDDLRSLDEDELVQPWGAAMANADAKVMRMSAAKTLPHPAGDLRFTERDTRRTFRDETRAVSAAAAIGALPGPAEAIHVVCAGQFSLWDVVPAIISLSKPSTIQTLHLASLAFSGDNLAALCKLLDAGAIGQVTMLISWYFRATSAYIAEPAMRTLQERNQRFVVVRNHCKIIAAKLTDKRTVTVESSANLRSKTNLEQMTFYGDPAVYGFHVGWMDALYSRAPNAAVEYAAPTAKQLKSATAEAK